MCLREGVHMVTKTEAEEKLGPLAPMWDRWTPAQDRFMGFEIDHFIKTQAHQVDELWEIKVTNPENREAYAKELVDCISVALNGLRWAANGDIDKVLEFIASRHDRYVDPHSIIDKYIANGWG